jgi:hypothetical protein
MKKLYIILTVVLAVLATTGVASASRPDPRTFLSRLSGGEEVPPRDTDAQGVAVYHLSRDESELRFVLAVAKIANVTAAHIHCGAAGVNGPIGVTLYMMAAPGGGPAQGVLARDTITEPDLGNTCNWTTLADVVAAMRSGNTYTNVHTNDGIDPPNTGPGDFPGGEIRGQIRAAGPTH